MTDFPTRLEQMLHEQAAACSVPGAALAVWHDGQLHETATGVCNIRTQVPVTPDTLFQIGSITKLYTTVLAMQLVEEGKLALDAPVHETLTDFRLADMEAANQITLRHLLNHTSGMDGDFFRDVGRGEDRIEKYVRELKDAPQIHEPGRIFSYCNSAFVLAGRMIEVASGMGWDKAMRNRIAKPLGTPAFSTLPEQAMRHQTAIGHVSMGGKTLVAPVAYLAQSNAPAGSTSMAAARDVINFARMLMQEGVAPNGTQIINAESAHQMHLRNVECPRHLHIDAIGLATFMWDWNGDGQYEINGHDGSTIGQAAWLRYHPESETAMVLLTNGGNGKGMADDIINAIFSEAAGLKAPSLPSPATQSHVDTQHYEGRYERSGGSITISEKDGKLIATHMPAAEFAVLQGSYNVELTQIDDILFTGIAPGYTRPSTYHFLERDNDGRALYLQHGVSVHRKTQ